MRERYHCGDVFPLLPHDLACTRPAGHEGPHGDGESVWTSQASDERRLRVWRAQAEAAERATHDARITALGGRPPRGGLVGNRAQRRAGLRLAADRVRRLGDGAATEAASASARETAAALRADVARLAEERDLRWGQVQEQATALRVVALWLGGAHHPSQPDDVAALARAKGAELDALRAAVEGRSTPPTDAEIEAHEAAGGRWRCIVRRGLR